MFLFVPCLSLSCVSLSRTFVLGPELMNLSYVTELPTLICYFKSVVQIKTGGRQFSDPLNSLNSVLVLTQERDKRRKGTSMGKREMLKHTITITITITTPAKFKHKVEIQECFKMLLYIFSFIFVFSLLCVFSSPTFIPVPQFTKCSTFPSVQRLTCLT